MRGEPGEVVLGRYRIECQIGRGGFGRIYLAQQVSLSRPVALKASAVEQRTDVAVRERFRREAVLVASIAHPNVVTYHDFGTDNEGDMILVMEYLRGRSLYEAVRSGEVWSLPEVAEVIRQAAEGLFAAHQVGIVHRDVKPSNLFLVSLPAAPARPEGGVVPARGPFLLKVIDFGILRVDAGVRPDLPDLTAPEAVIGTPAYLAPEMLMGARPDPRADQYALALVACELLTGRRAFGGPGNPDSFLARVSRPPPELDLVPGPAASVLARALSPDPKERFDTVVDFARSLGRALDETTPIRRNGPVALERQASEPQQGRRRRWAWRSWKIATLIAGAATLGLVALWVWTQPPAPPSPEREVHVERPRFELREPATAMVSERMAPESVPEPPIGGGPSEERRSKRADPSRSWLSGPREPSAPQSARPARVTINARPWADVWLNDKPLGRTPVINREVPPGTYTVRFAHPTLGTRSVRRTILPGQTLTLSEVLDSSEPPQDSRPGSQTP